MYDYDDLIKPFVENMVSNRSKSSFVPQTYAQNRPWAYK